MILHIKENQRMIIQTFKISGFFNVNNTLKTHVFHAQNIGRNVYCHIFRICYMVSMLMFTIKTSCLYDFIISEDRVGQFSRL